MTVLPHQSSLSREERERIRREAEAWSRDPHRREHFDSAQCFAGYCASLLAALEQAERERDEWMTPFEGSGIHSHEHEIGWKYTYQPSDFGKLVAAVHEYEVRCLQAEARLAKVPALVEAAKKAVNESVRLAPVDCTGDCGYAPCNCSGVFRYPESTQGLVNALAAWEGSA